MHGMSTAWRQSRTAMMTLSPARAQANHKRLARRTLPNLLRYKFLHEYGNDKGSVVVDAIVADICEVVRNYFVSAEPLEPGQLIYYCPDATERAARARPWPTPIPGYVADMGSWPTHKAAIIRLYLEGLTIPEIASRTYHSKKSWTATSKASNECRSWPPNTPSKNSPCCAPCPPGWLSNTCSSWKSTTCATQLSDAGGFTMPEPSRAVTFEIARNPEAASRLGYVLPTASSAPPWVTSKPNTTLEEEQ
jgi:hypothetical protein